FKETREQTVRLGSLIDEARITKAFEEWKGASARAAPYFRKAESIFRNRAAEEEEQIARALYQKGEIWYAARAARAEADAVVKLSSEVQGAMKRYSAMKKACELLLEFVRKDPYFELRNADHMDQLKDFHVAFSAVEEVLELWTRSILKGMEPPPRQGAASQLEPGKAPPPKTKADAA
ncbi:unnamed protein product, partial [Phaeothamnion confervicola]